MMTASYCDCLVCRLEASLIAELSGDRSSEEFRLFALSSTILSLFPTAFELLRQLHNQEVNQKCPSSDEVLFDLLSRSSESLFRPMGQQLLLLVFIPTVHRTTSQITGTFPALTRDDTAQHLFTVLLEFLDSQELRSRDSHFAFTIARKIRRSAFRWAVRESRRALRVETEVPQATPAEVDVGRDDSHAHLLLQQFLNNCERKGWLSTEERELLTQFKLEGLSSAELASHNGHSAVAIRHRVQRVVSRLRRIAQKSRNDLPEQLSLFRP